ncbi:hypothetical protein J437_LFUL015737 [Ladona fulva]|uniref:Signal peptidase complex subunit 3 n=1 Tax=Ladona fulva TaxID=123851 RepID=A0A8K0KK08_LADFU|nr:hypothetical protein J437_LFUL015737 [Ladona fulva]
MHSILTRGNAILAYTLSVLACLTFCCFISTVFIDYRTKAVMDTVKVVVKNVPDYSASREKNDLGFLTFNLPEYSTPNNKLNQVVLWDKIIQRGENAVLDFKNINTKYYFWDDGNGLRGHENITLTLAWNMIPNAGLLPNIFAHGSHSFHFPSEYTTSRDFLFRNLSFTKDGILYDVDRFIQMKEEFSGFQQAIFRMTSPGWNPENSNFVALPQMYKKQGLANRVMVSHFFNKKTVRHALVENRWLLHETIER